MVASGGFWLSAVAVPAVVNVADLLLLAVNTQLFTSQTHAAREWEVVAPHKNATGRPTSSRISEGPTSGLPDTAAAGARMTL
jgi:hypothetical protein